MSNRAQSSELKAQSSEHRAQRTEHRAQSTELRAQGAAVGEEPATTSEKRLADSVQPSGTASEGAMVSEERANCEPQASGRLVAGYRWLWRWFPLVMY